MAARLPRRGYGLGSELGALGEFLHSTEKRWKGAQIRQVGRGGEALVRKHCQSQVRGALGLRGVASPRLRVSMALRGPVGESWWGGGPCCCWWLGGGGIQMQGRV